MQRSKYDIWVGLFIIIGIVAVVFLALRVGNLVNLSFDKTYHVHAQFANVGGVKNGAAIRSAGVVVGRVRGITLDNERNQAIVDLEIKSQYQFPADSSLKIETSGLLGEEYITVLPGIESTTLEQMVQKDGAKALITRTQSSVSLAEAISQIFPGAEGNRPLLGQTYTVHAQFNNIGSIRVGSPVKSAGVLIGRVTQVGFDNIKFMAVITIELQSSYEFPDDVSLRIMSSGLIGGQFVEMTPGFSLEDKTLEQAALEATQAGKTLTINNTQSAIILEDLIGQLLYNFTGDKGSGKETVEQKANQ